MCLTSSIIWHICRKHDSIDSSFPEIVTARSVEVGNISDATWTDAPVVYKMNIDVILQIIKEHTSRISLIFAPPFPIIEPH